MFEVDDQLTDAAWHGHRTTVEQLEKYGAYVEALAGGIRPIA